MTDREGTTTVYAVTGYDVGGNSGFVVEALFTTRDAAEQYVAQDTVGQDAFGGGFVPLDIEEYELWTQAPQPYNYWHYGAEVYPDGEVKRWRHKKVTQAPGDIAPVDDHLEPWDGHMQGHCGLHISIFGSDLEAVKQAFKRQLATALGRVDGTCGKCGRQGPPWERDWIKPNDR